MVQPIEPQDEAEAGTVLARAFRDNPGVQAVLRGWGPEKRLSAMIPSMTGFVKGVRRYGVAECLKEDGRIIAVSLSFAPGRFPPPLAFEILTAFGPLRAGPMRALRFLRIDREMKRRHPTYPHWYLWFLGVEPELQGRGHGSTLLRALAERAARDQVPCYLETDKESSVRLYERHGYAVLSEELMPGFDFTLWFMRTRPVD